MLLCTAYVTGTLIALGLPANPDKIEPWKDLRFCPLVDASLLAARLPQVQIGFERLAATLEKRVQAALVSAATCPNAENCAAEAVPGEPK
jgi:hypothetical protein